MWHRITICAIVAVVVDVFIAQLDLRSHLVFHLMKVFCDFHHADYLIHARPPATGVRLFYDRIFIIIFEYLFITIQIHIQISNML